jgi:histidinol phosphatase-like PHP family hydrolase
MKLKVIHQHTGKTLEESDIKGIIHNHSNYSDGMNTLEEMSVHVRDAGYQYFAICDHSRSAFYANGLSAEQVVEQMQEIDKLNVKLAPFKIFKGIESDILGDGSLDYEDEVLAMFDLVVASIHSNLRMDEAKAMSRLITAIENPYTRILGHPTGRLLLARQGYPINHRKVIDACVANGVAIELNANPLRLDIDSPGSTSVWNAGIHQSRCSQPGTGRLCRVWVVAAEGRPQIGFMPQCFTRRVENGGRSEQWQAVRSLIK